MKDIGEAVMNRLLKAASGNIIEVTNGRNTWSLYGYMFWYIMAHTYFYGYKIKTSKGKSVIFLAFVLLGYIFAILSKIISDAVNWVFWFYVFNSLMVSTDIVMFYVNKKCDIRAELYSSNS